jgi:hypothetical protein
LHKRHPNLPHIAHTGGLFRLFPGARKDREQNACQDSDNRYHNKQLYQGKTTPMHRKHLLLKNFTL